MIRVATLRGKLAAYILGPLALVVLAADAVGYFVATGAASHAYDQSLHGTAVALADHFGEAPDGKIVALISVATQEALRADPRDTVFFELLGPDGAWIEGDRGLGEAVPLANTSRNGFGNTQFRGQSVRAMRMRTPCLQRTCTVVVAETNNKRADIARDVLVVIAASNVLVAAMVFLGVWFGVRRGLAPVLELSEEVSKRQLSDLSPLPIEAQPPELRPLLQSINRFLGALRATWDAEQRFIANAAHQLRTPLAALQAHAEALQSRSGPIDRAALMPLHEGTLRLTRLANQLLSLARAEPAVAANEAFKRVDLKALIEAGADAWVHLAFKRDIDLGFELAPLEVQGIDWLLTEAIGNLVHNAIEYTPAGGSVTVRLRREDARALVEVEDTGTGIPESERARVLERFYRVRGTAGAGSGLGLAIVRDIAELHRGSIALANRANGPGTLATLTLPLEP